MNHISIGGVQLDEIRIELNKISNELHQINESTRLHYGDITDLKFANEIIDEQRKAIKILKEKNEQLKSKNRGLQSELQIFKEDVTHSNLQINKLADENEQLKARIQYLERKIQRERNSHMKQHEKWEKEAETKIKELSEENEQLKHNNKMLSMKMSEVSTKYRLLKEFSEDTNPNEAVKTVLHELMMITKEYR